MDFLVVRSLFLGIPTTFKNFIKNSDFKIILVYTPIPFILIKKNYLELFFQVSWQVRKLTSAEETSFYLCAIATAIATATT